MDGDGIFGCYENLLDTVWFSEIGASKAILEAGYSLDSLMFMYQGVDWTNRSTWTCYRRWEEREREREHNKAKL